MEIINKSIHSNNLGNQNVFVIYNYNQNKHKQLLNNYLIKVTLIWNEYQNKNNITN